MKAAILGGSFDPVHIGHLLLADEIIARFGYDTILFVPAKKPPHKNLSGGASDDERLAMLHLAIEGDSRFKADRCELERDGISWMIETVRSIVSRFPIEGRPGLIIGDDLVSGFSLWRESWALAAEADIIVARRNQNTVPEFQYRHQAAENPLFPVSSTLIRERISKNGAFRYLLPFGVYSYIKDHGLYGITKNH